MKDRPEENSKSKISSVSILKIKVSLLNKAETLAWIEKKVEKKAKIRVVTPNPEQVVLAQKDPYFREILNSASLALADGVGLFWASKILPSRLKIAERVTGEETMRNLMKTAEKRGWKVFILGGKGEMVYEAERILKGKMPKLRLQVFPGSRNISKETRQRKVLVINKINEFKPDLLFVAYGAPWQEKWLYENWNALDVGVGMSVGGAVDMLVDRSLNPPRLMENMGLGWFYRLLRQPWRIKRQLALLEFIWLVLREKIRIDSR